MPTVRLAQLALLAAGAGLLMIFWPELLLPLADWAARDIVFRGSPSSKAVALTFDDGPDPVYTPQVLSILERSGVRATFFLVGERARKFPDLVGRIRAAGHEIGNHTDTWRNTIWLGTEEFEKDLLRAGETLGVNNASPRYFRPAGGTIRPSQLRRVKKHGYRCVLGSAIPLDPHRPPASWIEMLVRRSLKPGAIIVLHDSGGDRSRTVAALEPVLQSARRKGLRVVTVSELLTGSQH